jgi:(2Fe-2S) ferredoxin
MYSKHHFLISVAVGAAVALLTTSPYPWWVLLAVAAVVGVGVDLDHFLVAALNTGEWRALRRCLRDPTLVVRDQGAIFEAGEVGVIRRLLSHVVLGGALVGLLALRAPFLAAFVALVLYFHLLADLLWDLPVEPWEGGPDVLFFR